jgi:hypothetical protein
MSTKRTEAERARALAVAYTSSRTGAALAWALFHEGCTPAQIETLDGWVLAGCAPALLTTLPDDSLTVLVSVVVVDPKGTVVTLAVLDVTHGAVVNRMH